MTKIFSRSLLVFLIYTFMSVSICFGEDLVFVDADEDTGYYVDIDTISIEGKDFINATIAIIKANSNRMYLYNVKINHKDNSYQINSSKILEYDTKNLLESNEQRRPFRPYSPNSEMSELVKFIIEGGDLVDR